MGCRCCKIIQSYIFDPQDVQTQGYINEINNYKFDTQDGRKFKGKPSVEIQVHKNELQSDESQPSIHRNKLNNAKEAVRNQRNAALQEDGLSNRHEKSYIHINGVHPYSNLKSNHNTNQNKEAGRHACSAKGLSQPKECSDANLEAEHPKQPLAATESSQYRQSLTTGENGSATQSATLEAHSNDICSPGPDVSKHASQQRVAGSESPSNNHMHSTQSTEPTVSNEDGDWASCEANRCDSGDRACRTGTLNGCVKDKTVSDSYSPRPRPEASLEAGQVCCGEMNGEFEEEDADIAEALAALEAATAGEEFEEEEEEY
ncbi:uncharacterized protein C4orf19 homolog [Heteronotia binoei]|uniref:uncharacterized protein C4orf19 homolog n=1 Tax=Heteronotia binoei TaxID=13085 RepID=UPI00292DCB17|nr:uncharacterized protein C4orf19 homolog [Heteronotia binoei]XP_060102232.1 uncharacterized protein C4orf19 homolog [Heteronotia binoei]XP_060102233.1 uncharacterized protein C4orf19 homolog [Heteronotia binoei]